MLGTTDVEVTRLGFQHRLWSATAHALWERCDIRPGMTVLDVGSGPGHATLDLAAIVGPTGRVYAVDESAVFLKHLHDREVARRLTNVERVLGDVRALDTLLPHARGTVDLAYARWVLCFVADVEAVVRAVAGLLRPGGRFAIQDYFNYESMALAPRREPFERVIRAVGKSWRARGGDPDIVARLPGVFRRHGLALEHLSVNERLARPGGTMWYWPDRFWSSYVPRLVDGGFLTERDRHEFEACWREASSDPDSFMILPPVFDVVGVKR